MVKLLKKIFEKQSEAEDYAENARRWDADNRNWESQALRYDAMHRARKAGMR